MLAEAATPTGPEARSSTRTGGGREGTCTGPWRALSSGTCRVSRQPPLKSSQFVSGYKVICLSLAHGAKRWGCFAELISAATTSPWWPPASETSFSPSLRPSKKITSWWSGVFYKKVFKKMLPQKKWLGRGRPTWFFFSSSSVNQGTVYLWPTVFNVVFAHWFCVCVCDRSLSNSRSTQKQQSLRLH